VFQVDLPQIPGANIPSKDLNLLCKDVQLPGRQIATYDYQMGTKVEKIAYGNVTDDVAMTFLVLNDYAVKDYFDVWQKAAYNPDAFEIGYKSEYAKQVQIHQMRKGVSFPILNRSFGTFSIPSNIINRLPSFGPLDLSQGEFDLDFVVPPAKIYSVTLDRAWPVTANPISMNNEVDGIVELQVQFSYVRWSSTTY
jgi:hypothetical protein